MKILLISNNYPTKYTPYNGVFVQNAAKEMKRQSCEVTPVAPISWVSQIKRGFPSAGFENGEAAALTPFYTSLPLSFAPSKRLFSAFNDRQMARALMRQVRKFENLTDFDLCYAHFLPSGRASLAAFPELPVFLAMGESDPWLYDEIYGVEWADELSEFAGIFTVSKNLHDYLIGRNPNIERKTHCTPNGVDTEFFSPMPKSFARKELGVEPNVSLALFVGNFEDRKGPQRVLDACRRLGVHAAFLGSGRQRPVGDMVLFEGRVAREHLRLWLAAVDCFVLPSLSEGRSNAILEALAMGTPCVVSDRPFNREFLNDETVVFVDPLSVEAIANGISRVMREDENKRLSLAGRNLAETLSHSARIEKMLTIMRRGDARG